MSLIKELSFCKHKVTCTLNHFVRDTLYEFYVCLHSNSNAHQSGTRVRSQDQFYWLTFLNLILFTFVFSNLFLCCRLCRPPIAYEVDTDSMNRISLPPPPPVLILPACVCQRYLDVATQPENCRFLPHLTC